MTTNFFARRVVRVVPLAVIAVGVLFGQKPLAVDVNDSRPLIGALEALQLSCGVAVNYEDVTYQNAADLEDISTPQQRAQYPGYHLMIPRRGRVGGSLDTTALSSVAGQLSAVQALVTSYRNNNLPGEFAVEQANGQIYVIGTKGLGASGKLVDVTSPMTVRISIPFAERSIVDTVEAITLAVSKASRTTIDVGTVPPSPNSKVSFGADQEVARNAVARLFAQISTAPVSYRLMFDPTMKTYMFNMLWGPYSTTTTPIATPNAEGNTGASPLWRQVNK
jgi:hypothetical protein